MNSYSWTPSYLAVLEEQDRARLQQGIANARREIMTRYSQLMSTSCMSETQREEWRLLCDARRVLDLLHQVSEDGQSSATEPGAVAAKMEKLQRVKYLCDEITKEKDNLRFNELVSDLQQELQAPMTSGSRTYTKSSSASHDKPAKTSPPDSWML